MKSEKIHQSARVISLTQEIGPLQNIKLQIYNTDFYGLKKMAKLGITSINLACLLVVIKNKLSRECVLVSVPRLSQSEKEKKN